MVNSAPETSPTQPTQQRSVKAPLQPKQTKNLKIPLVIVIVIAALSLSSSIYLAYQNQLVKQQLSEISITPTPTPTPTPVSTQTANPTKEVASLQNNEEDDGLTPRADVCYENNDYYLIFLKNYPTKNGRSLVVKNKTEDMSNYECKYDYRDMNDLFVEGPIRYLELFDNILLIDLGTGPTVRGIQIYDLAEKPKIYATTYTGTEDINEKYIEYWKPTDIVATHENCSSKEPWTIDAHMAGIDQKVRFEYKTLEETVFEEYRCSGRQ